MLALPELTLYGVMAETLEVRLVGGGGASLTQALTAVGAVVSPVVALIVALWVTSRTIRNDRQQRALERKQDWLKQLQEQQLAASAAFASQVFQSRVELERLNPRTREASSDELVESRRILELARSDMSKAQLLFGATHEAREAAQKVIDSLNTAQVALEERKATDDEISRANKEEEYAASLDSAGVAYETFLRTATVAIASPPDV